MKNKKNPNNNNNNSSKKKPKDAENSALRVRVALRAVRWGGAAIGAVSLPTEGRLKARRSDTARACRQGTRGRCHDVTIHATGAKTAICKKCGCPCSLYAKTQKVAGALSGVLQRFTLGFS